ncbi:MAG: hypothetical protein QMC89_05130 [Candidatus Hodarchaeaceae archaeon]|nr:hypothetical protein [Candidatus Hodarchaeaceae archaeon]
MCRSDGKAIFTGIREPAQNLNDIPFPARHLITNIRYGSLRHEAGYQISNKNFFRSGIVPWLSLWLHILFMHGVLGQRVRARSPENVVDEIENLVNDRGVEQIFMVDDNFTMFPKRVMEICGLIKERNIDIDWICTGGSTPHLKKCIKAWSALAVD